MITDDDRIDRYLRDTRDRLTLSIRMKSEDIAKLTEQLAQVNAQLKIDNETER